MALNQEFTFPTMKPSPLTSTCSLVNHQYNTSTFSGAAEKLTYQDTSGPFEESPQPFIIAHTSSEDRSSPEVDTCDNASLFPPELACQILLSPPPPPRRSLLRAVTRSFSRSRSRDPRDKARFVVRDEPPPPVPPIPVQGGISVSNATSNPPSSRSTTSPTSPALSKPTVLMKQLMRRTTAILRLKKPSTRSLDPNPASPTSPLSLTLQATALQSFDTGRHDSLLPPKRQSSRIRASTLPNRTKPAFNTRDDGEAGGHVHISAIRPVGHGANDSEWCRIY